VYATIFETDALESLLGDLSRSLKVIGNAAVRKGLIITVTFYTNLSLTNL